MLKSVAHQAQVVIAMSDQIDSLKAEITTLRQQLAEQQRITHRLKQKVFSLTTKNNKLRNTLNYQWRKKENARIKALPDGQVIVKGIF